jgi:hypothetical protein
MALKFIMPSVIILSVVAPCYKNTPVQNEEEKVLWHWRQKTTTSLDKLSSENNLDVCLNKVLKKSAKSETPVADKSESDSGPSLKKTESQDLSSDSEEVKQTDEMECHL